jgi:hypothetical protein
MTEEKDDDVYVLTPYGLIQSTINEQTAKDVIDELTLYMIRQAEPGRFMAIVAEGGFLKFVQVERASS